MCACCSLDAPSHFEGELEMRIRIVFDPCVQCLLLLSREVPVMWPFPSTTKCAENSWGKGRDVCLLLGPCRVIDCFACWDISCLPSAHCRAAVPTAVGYGYHFQCTNSYTFPSFPIYFKGVLNVWGFLLTLGPTWKLTIAISGPLYMLPVHESIWTVSKFCSMQVCCCLPKLLFTWVDDLPPLC